MRLNKISFLLTLLLLLVLTVVAYAEDGEPLDDFYYQPVIVTAYTASIAECGKMDAVTASGVTATEGRTAACDFLPFGTLIAIDGHVYTVEDRFGGNYQNRVDIFMNNTNDAWAFGKQYKIMLIYA